MNYKIDGFNGQRAIVLPKSIIHEFCLSNQIINKTYITDLGYYPKAHYHYRKRPLGAEQNILIYCLEGNGAVTINSNSYNVVPGDYFIIPRNAPHHYKTDEKKPWTIYWCHFMGEQADAIVQRMINKSTSYKYSIDFLQERIATFDQLYSNLERGYSNENIIYANLLFLQFLSSFLFSEKHAVDLQDNKPRFFEKSIRLMQDNIDKDLTLSNFARHVNYSPSHFSSIFKSETGYSPIEYFNHLKIQKACQYLQFTNLRVKEIAYKIGFKDAYYFSRLFAKLMGCSPKVYRQSRSMAK